MFGQGRLAPLPKRFAVGDGTTVGIKGFGRERALVLPAGSEAPVSTPERASVRYNETTAQIEASISGSPYAPIGADGIPAAAVQPAWWIDPINGDDANVGDSPTSAIRTHEEFRRRIGSQSIDIPMTINLVDDFPVDNPVIVDFQLGGNGFLSYVGTKAPTVLASGTLTASIPFNAATNQAQVVEDTALPTDWGPAGLINGDGSGRAKRMRITSGPSAQAVAWPVLDLGARQARVSAFGLPGLAPAPFRLTVPGVGDGYVVEEGFARISRLFIALKTPPAWPLGINATLFMTMTDVDVDLSANVRPVYGVSGTSAAAPSIVMIRSCCGQMEIQGPGGAVGTDFCLIGSEPGGSNVQVRSGRADIGGGAILGGGSGRNFTAQPGSRVQVFAHVLSQGAQLQSRGLLTLGDVGVFDVQGSGVQVLGGGHCEVGGFGTTLYGQGNTAFGASLRANSNLAYLPTGPDASSSITITGSSGEFDIAGTGPQTWASAAPDLTDPNKLAGVSANT